MSAVPKIHSAGSSTPSAIVCRLHDSGFVSDFHLVGNDLLWVQGNLFIRAGEFSILEYYEIPSPADRCDHVVVFGIIAPFQDIKGILLNHYKSYTNSIPPVIRKKLIEAGFTQQGNNFYK